MAIIDFMKASINFTDNLDFTYFINCIDFVDLIDYIDFCTESPPLYSKLILNCLFIVFMAIIDFMKASINFTDYLDFTYFINCIDFVDLIDYIGLTK